LLPNNKIQTKVIKKLFPVNNLIDLIPGGPIASDPIFIMAKDDVIHDTVRLYLNIEF